MNAGYSGGIGGMGRERHVTTQRSPANMEPHKEPDSEAVAKFS